MSEISDTGDPRTPGRSKYNKIWYQLKSGFHIRSRLKSGFQKVRERYSVPMRLRIAVTRAVIVAIIAVVMALFWYAATNPAGAWWLMYCLIFLGLCIPLIWFSGISQRWLELNLHQPTRISEFFADTVTVLVPFFVLAVALYVELPKIMEHGVQSLYTLATLAGIMILYSLSLLGGFVFVQLVQTRQDIHNTIRMASGEMVAASKWLASADMLSDARDEFIPTPAGAAQSMIRAWAELHCSGEKLSDAAAPAKKLQALVRHACIATLLDTYAKEERMDISGALSLNRIPRAARPPVGSTEEAKGKITYIATNVAYYGTYLKEVVAQLQRTGKTSQDGSSYHPCMAVVTYVLPTHGWNWPTENPKRDEIYPPAVQYWVSQQQFAANFGQIFRRILVSNFSDPKKDTLKKDISKEDIKPQRLYPISNQLVKGLLHKTLYFVVEHRDKKGKPDRNRTVLDQIEMSRPSEDGENKVPGTERNPDDITPTTAGLLVDNIRHAAMEGSTAPVYWMLDFESDNHDKCICKGCADKKHPTCVKRVEDIYRDAFHPSGGYTEIITVKNPEFLTNKMKEQWTPGESLPGLGDCLDIVFLGISNSEDVWKEQSPKWGCALMATLGPNTETMFLTVIHDETIVERLWTSIGTAFRANKQNLGARPYRIEPEEKTDEGNQGAHHLRNRKMSRG